MPVIGKKIVKYGARKLGNAFAFAAIAIRMRLRRIVVVTFYKMMSTTTFTSMAMFIINSTHSATARLIANKGKIDVLLFWCFPSISSYTF